MLLATTCLFTWESHLLFVVVVVVVVLVVVVLVVVLEKCPKLPGWGDDPTC